MTPAEQREILTWGGAAGGLLVVGWILVYGIFTNGDEGKAHELYGKYQGYYLNEGGARIPAGEAVKQVERVYAEQQKQLEAAAGATVFPGEGPVPEEFRGTGGVELTQNYGYARRVDLVGRINDRLQGAIRSRGIECRPKLPFTDKDSLSASDEALASLQMAQVAAYTALVEVLLNASVSRIKELVLERSIVADASGSYAVIPVRIELDLSLSSVDGLMRDLRDHRGGLVLQNCEIIPQAESKNLQFLSLNVSLVVNCRPDWLTSSSVKLPRKELAWPIKNTKPIPASPAKPSAGGAGRMTL